MMTRKKITITIILVAVLIFASTLWKALYKPGQDEIPVPSTNTFLEHDPLAVPVLVTIPKINVEAKVQEVGLTKGNNMATPNNYTDVGWYKYGALPGNVGSAVIAGHVDNGLGRPAVLNKLSELAIGDEINVKTKGGTDLKFAVTRLETYDYDARDTNVFSEEERNLLKIITCTGDFDSKIKTHEKRLVVVATLQK